MYEILGIAIFVLTPVVWWLMHRYFSFIYFGNIANALAKELAASFFISFFVVCLFGSLMQRLFSGVVSLVLFLLKAALVIGGIVLAAALVIAVVNKVCSLKSESGTTEGGEDAVCPPQQPAAEQGTEDAAETETAPQAAP